jgi:hypothetical protein
VGQGFLVSGFFFERRNTGRGGGAVRRGRHGAEGGEAKERRIFYVPSLFSTSFFLVVEINLYLDSQSVHVNFKKYQHKILYLRWPK